MGPAGWGRSPPPIGEAQPSLPNLIDEPTRVDIRNSVPKNVRYLFLTKKCPIFVLHQKMSGMCSAPKNVRHLLDTN